MGSSNGILNGHQNSKQIIIESKLGYFSAPSGSNVARELYKSFHRYSTKTLVIDSFSGREYNGHDLLSQASRIATGFIESNTKVNVNDSILLMCDHSIRELFLMFGALLSGATIIGTASEGLDDLKVACEPTQPSIIVTSNRLFDVATRLRLDVPGMSNSRIILIEEECSIDLKNESSTFHANFLFEWPRINDEVIKKRINEQIQPHIHYSMHMITSGSTGRSKIVPWTHEKQLRDIWSIISATKSKLPGYELPLLPLDSSVVLAGDLPVDQGAGLVSMLWCLIVGGKYILMKSYDEEKFWRDIERFKVTGSVASSTFTHRALRRLKYYIDEDIHTKIDLSSIKYICCVGCKVSLDKLLSDIWPIYKNIQVTQFYGATEIGLIAMLAVEDARQGHLSSVGHLFPGVRAKVLNVETGESVNANDEGEMLVWSPTLFKSYLPHPEERLEDLMRGRFDEDGFYRTGDLVHYDEDGRFYIHSRIRDTLYLEEDLKTTPGEIEAAVNKHPLVSSSVVVGVPNPEVDNCVLPKAFIKLKKDSELETLEDEYLLQLLNENKIDLIQKDIFEFTAKLLSSQKHLNGGIRFLDDFPKVGRLNKIDRRTLEKMD